MADQHEYLVDMRAIVTARVRAKSWEEAERILLDIVNNAEPTQIGYANGGGIDATFALDTIRNGMQLRVVEIDGEAL